MSFCQPPVAAVATFYRTGSMHTLDLIKSASLLGSSRLVYLICSVSVEFDEMFSGEIKVHQMFSWPFICLLNATPQFTNSSLFVSFLPPCFILFAHFLVFLLRLGTSLTYSFVDWCALYQFLCRC